MSAFLTGLCVVVGIPLAVYLFACIGSTIDDRRKR